MSKWRDVAVSFTVELGREQDAGEAWLPWADLTYEKPLPASLLAELDRLVPSSCDGLELDFDIRSSGSYNPNDPDTGDEERTCKGVSLLLDGKEIPLPLEVAGELAGLYREVFEAKELPDCEPDYDDGGEYC
jgi:hypothetical protein